LPWLVLLGLVAGCGDRITGPDPDSPLGAFVLLMNDHRVAVGCAPLAWHGEMAAVAHAHSVDMVERSFFSHTNPDGKSPFDRMRDAGIDYSRAAENIAYGYDTGESVLQGWLNSSGHRQNIENCALTEHGVGKHQTHWTHLFRTP
jgi:uncharacterized protein YkwD